MKYFFYLPKNNFITNTQRGNHLVAPHPEMALYVDRYGDLILLPVQNINVPDVQWCDGDEVILVTKINPTDAREYCKKINETCGKQMGFELCVFQKQ